MHRSLSLVLAVAALLVAAAPASARTTRFFFEFTRFDPVDAAPAGDSGGDMTVFAFRVHDRTAGGRPLGAGRGYCVRTEVGIAYACMAHIGLPGGRLVVAWEELDGESSKMAAILGGTGFYKAARGDLRLTSVGPGGRR